VWSKKRYYRKINQVILLYEDTVKALLFVLLALALPVQAEVFKCKISEFKTVYQTK